MTKALFPLDQQNTSIVFKLFVCLIRFLKKYFFVKERNYDRYVGNKYIQLMLNQPNIDIKMLKRKTKKTKQFIHVLYVG